MKRAVIAVGLVAVLALVAGALAPVLAETACERAEIIRKQVAASDKMPAEVKEDLLKKAAALCPLIEAADLTKKGDELVSQGKLTEALAEFELALAAKDPNACKRCFEIAQKLKADGKIADARRFFEAGLSVCYDQKVYKEYQSLPQKVASNLEAKGGDQAGPDLIKKETIVQSLLARPSHRSDREDIGMDPRRQHRGDWSDRDDDRYDRDWSRRSDRSDRSDRYSRYDRYARYDDRYRWADDENTGTQSFPIQFESGSATLTHRGRMQLDELAHAVKSRELGNVHRFFIDGHTDSIGTEESNCDLGFRRAESVVRYLVEKWNISPRRLMARSFGQNRPIAPNYDEQGRFDNRRVEVRNADMARDDSRYARGRCH
jgi:outer membrane protein OmpA-like peptidoglycan-associated protein